MQFRRLLCVFFLAALLSGCGEEVLYSSLTPKDANEMAALLMRSGIEATRKVQEGGSYQLLVAGKDFAPSVEILSRAGYPKENFRSMAEIFPGDGLIVSPFEQRARLTFAMNQELSHTIGGIEGVVSARVHVVIPETDLRAVAPPKSSASVVVHHRPGVDTAVLASKIRLIVANAVSELDFRDVSIAFFEAEDFQASAPLAPVGGQAPASASGGSSSSVFGQFNWLVPIFLWGAAGLAAVAAGFMFVRRMRTS